MTLHKRSVALLLLVIPFVSCQERLADGEPLDGLKVCTFVNAAKVYDEQGEPVSSVHAAGGGSSQACLCLTLEQTWSGDYDDYFNDRALELCLEDATRMGYPEANDCAYWHAQGHWIDMIRTDPFVDNVECDPNGESEPLGCSVR